MVGLTFAALNVATAEACTPMPDCTAAENLKMTTKLSSSNAQGVTSNYIAVEQREVREADDFVDGGDVSATEKQSKQEAQTEFSFEKAEGAKVSEMQNKAVDGKGQIDEDQGTTEPLTMDVTINGYAECFREVGAERGSNKIYHKKIHQQKVTKSPNRCSPFQYEKPVTHKAGRIQDQRLGHKIDVRGKHK